MGCVRQARRGRAACVGAFGGWVAILAGTATACGSNAAVVDAGVDAAPPSCPSDMVEGIGQGFCIDRYEASRSEDGLPLSVAGAQPWTYVTVTEAAYACDAVGKRLCEVEEWVAACVGPSPGHVYPYGDTYDPQACNGVDRAQPAPTETGSLAACEGGFDGLFDMSGNVAEFTIECNGWACDTRGGSWDWGEDRLRCDAAGLNNGDRQWDVGFRCCSTL